MCEWPITYLQDVVSMASVTGSIILLHYHCLYKKTRICKKKKKIKRQKSKPPTFDKMSCSHSYCFYYTNNPLDGDDIKTNKFISNS